MSNAIRCYRPDGTCYAVIAPTEWATLRKAGRLDAELKRRRETGVVIAVAPLPQTPAPAHFKPRGDDSAPLLEWSPLRYPCDDLECGPARRNPVNGCVRCGSCDADSYASDGTCNACAEPPESFHDASCPALAAPENPCACDGPDDLAAEREAIEADRKAGLVP